MKGRRSVQIEHSPSHWAGLHVAYLLEKREALPQRRQTGGRLCVSPASVQHGQRRSRRHRRFMADMPERSRMFELSSPNAIAVVGSLVREPNVSMFQDFDLGILPASERIVVGDNGLTLRRQRFSPEALGFQKQAQRHRIARARLAGTSAIEFGADPYLLCERFSLRSRRLDLGISRRHAAVIQTQETLGL